MSSYLELTFEVDGMISNILNGQRVDYIRFDDVFTVEVLPNRVTITLRNDINYHFSIPADETILIKNKHQTDELSRLQVDRSPVEALGIIINKAVALWLTSTRFGRKNVAEGW